VQVSASKTKIYMVLEYVNGGELFDKIVRILPLNCKLVRSHALWTNEANSCYQRLSNAYQTQSSICAGVEG
jgi:hypothetical protein